MDMECSLAVAVLFREWSGVLCFETILLFVFHVMSLRVFFYIRAFLCVLVTCGWISYDFFCFNVLDSSGKGHTGYVVSCELYLLMRGA
jgi:hypothetical protein